MNEIWKGIPTYESRYQVSSLGRIKSLNWKGNTGKEKILKPRVCLNGYITITLCVDHIKKDLLIHRLVLKAFLGESILDVNHKNGIKSDNRLENLEYCTKSENIIHSYENLGRTNGLLGKRGYLSKTAKIILQIKNGKVINEFFGSREAQRITGIEASNIGACCRGKLKQAGGFEWKYR